MIYTVTYCTFDRTVGGNPFWHGSVLLSRMDETTKQLEVVDTWSFYGIPSNGDKKSWTGWLKSQLGLNIDLQGNHGWITHEEVRFMDKGHGLHGDTFEVTEDTFNQVQKEWERRVTAQEAAVNEALANVDPSTLSAKDAKRYPGDKFSHAIFQIEQNKAKIEQREPRLHPFDINVSVCRTGLSFKDTHNCHTETLDILSNFLPAEHLGAYKKSVFPRFVSGSMEELRLHSVGPFETHTKSASVKEQNYFRKLMNNGLGRFGFYNVKPAATQAKAPEMKIQYRSKDTPGVKLYWTVPPQKFTALPGSKAKELFALDKEYIDEVYTIVNKLQRLEWLLRNAVAPEQYNECRENLIQQVIEGYKVFSIIEPKEKTEKLSGLRGTLFSLFAPPRTRESRDLHKYINNGKGLFAALDMAIAEGWIIDETRPSELDPALTLDDDCNELEAFVSYLSPSDQMELCNIIGRTYCKPAALDLPRANVG